MINHNQFHTTRTHCKLANRIDLSCVVYLRMLQHKVQLSFSSQMVFEPWLWFSIHACGVHQNTSCIIYSNSLKIESIITITDCSIVVLENKIFKHFPYTVLTRLSHLSDSRPLSGSAQGLLHVYTSRPRVNPK